MRCFKKRSMLLLGILMATAQTRDANDRMDIFKLNDDDLVILTPKTLDDLQTPPEGDHE